MKHLKDKNLTYLQHLGGAWTLALQLFLLSLIALVHGMLPFTWVRSVSDRIHTLDEELS
jgi:hypothetical protein